MEADPVADSLNFKHFELEEFACPCCRANRINHGFVRLLDMARVLAGIPFIITSGFRCAKHNREVGGKPDSAHLEGTAADIEILSSNHRYHVLVALIAQGFVRIGIGKNFVHVDMSTNKLSNVIWTYY